MQPKILLPLALLTLCSICTHAFADRVFYKGSEGPGKGKHLVLVASDHEYRAEETIPALARILSVHGGFDCTVVFGVTEQGEIQAGISNLPAIPVLSKADGLVLFVRFLALPPEQMKHIDDYINRGGPVVGLRTSTHAFKYDKNRANDPYAKYDFKYAGKDFKGGFGEQILGQSWVGHYGQNHRQSTRIDLIPEQKDHPILRGVSKVHVQAGGYNAEAQPDWDILTMAQPLMSMEPDGKDDPQKPPMASEWTREYTAKNGKKGRVFTSLYGASQDLLNPGYRRLILNGIYWSVGLEEKIKADAKIDFVGSYNPSKFQVRGEAKGIKPAMYADLKSPIPADPKAELKKVESVTAKNQNIRKRARFLRIEIPGDNKILTLNEVEIISGGKNIAPMGKATQSSVGAGGVASRAIDGNKNHDYKKGGQTHTDGFGSTNPWWEIDLGGEYAIDEVEVWNRKGYESRLDGFTIQLLDSNRKQVYKSGKTKGSQRIKFTLRFRTVLEFFLYDGKPEPEVKKPAPKRAEVPADYKDELPFAFRKGDRIAILGNGLADRMQHDGWMETLFQSEL
ncbi:MAG: ThuA domain-containing protein, partial [Betaproteobacteria bacterium]